MAMSTWDAMVAGKPYVAESPDLAAVRAEHLAVQDRLNALGAADLDRVRELAPQLFGSFGAGSTLVPPIYFDYGANTTVGENVFINTGTIILDCAPVHIGNEVMIGPRVTITAASHPVHPGTRRSLIEYAKPITIEDGVWIGASATIGPGVTIGENSVVGAGAVVLHDVPANVVVGGVPARVLHEIGERDAERGREFVAGYREWSGIDKSEEAGF
ncbi:sugar O-acetyltransferase [Neoactinobaculum massilliense]|uniref:sugar O-acetyltransferase n=1 Tax=Neoactinobaculum massilliense TaxID=2364794 RepID=UPI000F533D3E|nr:sugar O-acetyltransferase [Neoactinobaculum massilliense]